MRLRSSNDCSRRYLALSALLLLLLNRRRGLRLFACSLGIGISTLFDLKVTRLCD
jgi:hypothetical protein